MHNTDTRLVALLLSITAAMPVPRIVFFFVIFFFFFCGSGSLERVYVTALEVKVSDGPFLNNRIQFYCSPATVSTLCSGDDGIGIPFSAAKWKSFLSLPLGLTHCAGLFT